MTYEERKSLYESIMTDVARIVKSHLNEAYNSNILKKFIEFSKEEAKKHKDYLEIHYIVEGRNFEILNVKYDGTVFNGIYKNHLSDLSDDNIYGNQFYVGTEIKKVLKGETPSFERIRNITSKTNHLSCLVLVDWNDIKNDYSKEVIAALFINPAGTKEFYDSMKKSLDRKQEKVIKISDDPKKWTTAEWKDVYSKIKNNYNKFKNEYGDKAALELSETVNKLVANQNVITALNKILQTSLDKKTATKYLYCFLLDIKSLWFNRTLKKDERFLKIYQKFHPDKKDD